MTDPTRATARILIVDDEPGMVRTIGTTLRRSGHQCRGFASAREALVELEESGADVVLTDWRMPGMDGLELLAAVRSKAPDVPVVLITAHADVPSAVRAMQAGAFDYLAKPFDNDELRAVVARALELTRLQRENRYLRRQMRDRLPSDELIAESPASREVLGLVRRIAPSDSTVLIEGDSGTGKELIAKALHYWSHRVGEPLVSVNCAALAEGVLESELFGHEKGAFTGAVRERAGCFERAHRGTLFLDEIGEISSEFQAKLLRVVQEGEVTRVGGDHCHRVDVRLIAATNRDLRLEVDAGRFREDLYYRLSVLPIRLRPLRERPEDILALARFFLDRQGADGTTRTLSKETDSKLLAHHWPGNVRELENVMERALILSGNEILQPEDLLLDAPAPATSTADESLRDAVDRITVARIRDALRASSGRRTEAAERLGIERTTLYRLMRRFSLELGEG